jgi:DNA-binding response OmpR family regulator
LGETVARILCVDDEPAAVIVRKEILESAGYTVTPCLSVEAAVRELETTEYDAVVTDWKFEAGSGRAVVQAAKTKASLPVVVVSGFVGEAFHSAEPLADIYLEKPADARELLQVLKILLEVKAHRVRKTQS